MKSKKNFFQTKIELEKLKNDDYKSNKGGCRHAECIQA